MIPHTQKILSDPARGDGNDGSGRPGDCWRACVASLLDVEDYDSVPHFVELDDWWGLTCSFVRERTGKSVAWWDNPESIPLGIDLLIGSGPSPRGNFWHAVIVDRQGNLVHDPHPSRAGVLEVKEFFSPVEVQS